MRPRRGTELHGRRLFLGLVVLGVVVAVLNAARLATESMGVLGVLSSIGFVFVGASTAWRGGYMLEWWGPPESVFQRRRRS